MPYAPVGATVHLITGAPCSGKTTHVHAHARPTDLVVDFDAIADALTTGDGRDRADAIIPFICEARDAILNRLHRGHRVTTVWVTTATADKAEVDRLQRKLQATVTHITATPMECMERAKALGRGPDYLEAIRRWFAGGAPTTRPSSRGRYARPGSRNL
jgi:predicted kinase